MERWTIYIDVEGFSKVYLRDLTHALLPLRAMMESLYHIGDKICPETPNRLFAHQIGDGFVIVSEFAERSPELPIAIATVLMRRVAMAGGMSKSAISQGEFADIKGCYPDVIRSNADASGTVRLGRGLMRIFPVMGIALINTYRLSNRESGSLLLVDTDLSKQLPQGVILTKSISEYKVVDWIHTDMPEIDEIRQGAGIKMSSVAELEDIVRQYIASAGPSLPQAWIQNTLLLNNCKS